MSRELITAVLAYFLFWRYAQFTEVQATILAVMAGALASVVLAPEKTPARFEPFYIRITPRWNHILHDQGLINDQTWMSLNSEGSAGSREVYSVFQDGITIAVLGPQLYYSQNHRSFFSELDLSEPIRELLRPEERENSFSCAPRLYVKLTHERAAKHPRIRCIQVGLVTPESLKKSIHPSDDRSNVPLATLPHALFNGYFEVDGKLKETEVEQLLKEYGWERGERDDNDHWLNWPFELNHKYVKVSYLGV